MNVLDLPGSSLLAIQRLRNLNGGELEAVIYRYADRKFLVTSVMSIPGSLSLETGQPSVLPIDASDEDLGRVVCEHLLRHDPREPPNQRHAKLTDWAVFKVSGDRSVSGFNSKSSRVTVQTINLILQLEAAPVRSLHGDICVQVTARLEHGELGVSIRKALRAADALRQAGIV